MNRLLKAAVLGTAVAATTLAALPAANAGDGWRRYYGDPYPRYETRQRSDHGDALAAGIIGLAAGALIGGALASQPAPRPAPRYYESYEAPRPAPVRTYYRQAPDPYYSGGYRQAYQGGIEPWTPDWYSYCQDRYRSFKPRSGTFTGYDGQEHFCVAN